MGAVRRRWVAVATAVVIPLALVVLPMPKAQPPVATAFPVADNELAYTGCGRVFPDPQAYGPAPVPAAGESPWAKGNLPCRATTFIQWDEALSGLNFLATKFPGFVEVYDLSQTFDGVLDRENGEGMSAGIPIATLERVQSPLIIVRVTDESIPDTQKKLYVFPLSIHGIERAGVEGGIRAAEDLATWAANTPEQPIMETDDTSLPAGEVLKKAAAYFVLANPDGWRRGSVGASGAAPAFQRYNGNGIDMNRDWPALGYTFRPYTPWSEPETRSFGKVLKSIRNKWDGGIDLHGQLIDRAFSFTLLGGSQRPYDKNERVLQFTRGAWADAEKRLAWNPLIKPNDAPEACVPPGTGGEVNEPPDCDPTPRVYGVQWGSIWDTIAYTVTGAFGDWIDSPLGLDADGIDNEMSLSHLSNCGTGTCYIQSAEQLHVDGNKSLIYAMLNYGLLPEDQTFRHAGKAAYLWHPNRVSDAGRPSPKAPAGAVAQDDITTQVVHNGQAETMFEFDVEGPPVYNGGVRARSTFVNAQGVSPGATLTTAIDMQNADGEWVELNKDFNQSNLYVQAGQSVEVNFPKPGHYRYRVAGPSPMAVELLIDFTVAPAWPDPGQLPYSVSNLDFFTDLEPFTERPDQLTQLPIADVLAGKSLRAFDTIIVADGVLPKDAGSRAAVAKTLRAFATQGGNVVLTDDAMVGLEAMGIVPAGSVSNVDQYAGNVEFQRTVEGVVEVTYDDPLAANINQPGAAEGPNHRHQVTEPVPTGYSIQGEGGGDENHIPDWSVDVDAFEGAGGRVAGSLGTDVTLGEIPVGNGKVRILGSFLPVPTEEFDHPFGLADYAITYTGYELAKNLFNYVNPLGTTGSVPQPAPVPQPQPNPQPKPGPGTPMPATGTDTPYALVAVLTAAIALAVRRRFALR